MNCIRLVIVPERLHITTHGLEDSFSTKTRFYETSNIFFLTTKAIYTKPLIAPESALRQRQLRVGDISKFSISVELFAKKDFCIIVKYLQNHKCHFRKPLQSSKKNTNNNYPETVPPFFTGCSILNCFQGLNFCNFRIILAKLIRSQFLETAY